MSNGQAGSTDGSAPNAGPRAISRVLRLFDLLATRRGGMTLSEASEALGVPKSTLLSSLKGLAQDGFLISEGSTYVLGPAAYRLAGTIMSSWSMSDVVRPQVRSLADETRESVGFAIVDWEIGQVIYTEGVNSPQPVHYAMRVGVRAPLYASAAGRVLLAFAPEHRQSEYLARKTFKALTDATVTTSDQLRRQLAEVRQLGYCASFGELLNDTAAIAVPVFDPGNEVIGALMVAAPLERMKAKYDQLLESVTSHGRRASGLDAAGYPSPM